MRFAGAERGGDVEQGRGIRFRERALALRELVVQLDAGRQHLTASGQYEVVALGGDVNWRWNTLRGINYFLASNTNPAVLEKTRNNHNSIARFFRAWFYFEKVKRYGDVPWIDKPPAHQPGAEAEPGVVGVIPGGVEESAP